MAFSGSQNSKIAGAEDVALSNPIGGQVLQYDDDDDKWKNATLSPSGSGALEVQDVNGLQGLLDTKAPVSAGLHRWQAGEATPSPLAPGIYWVVLNDGDAVPAWVPEGSLITRYSSDVVPPAPPFSTLVSWSGDGLVEGVLSASSVGAGDTSPTATVGTAAPTIVASGSRSPQIRVMASPPTDQSGVYWQVSPQAQGGGRVYFTTPSSFPQTGQIPDIFWIRSGATAIASIDITSTGRFNLRDSSNVISQTSTGFWSVNQRYRLEWQVDHTLGSLGVKIFEGDATTPIGQLSGSSPLLGESHDRIYIGKLNSAEMTTPIYFDDVLITDAAVYPGPKG